MPDYPMVDSNPGACIPCQQTVKFEKAGDAIKIATQNGESAYEQLERLKCQLNVATPELATYLTQVIASCQPGTKLEDLNGIVAALGEIQPKDPLETLLVIQMFMANRRAGIAIKESCKAMLPEDQERQVAIATRLMRLFTQQMETLRKYRNGNNQTINVNYINANQSVVNTGGIGK